MNDSNYTHTCQVCNEQYAPKLNQDGTPRVKKHSFCSVLCKGRYYKPLLNKKRTYGLGKTRKCDCCGKEFERKRDFNFKIVYCSIQCSAAMANKSRSVDRSCPDYQKRIVYKKTLANVIRPEVRSLNRIAEGVKQRTRSCANCGESILRRRRFFRFCDDECRSISMLESNDAYRKTESYRSAKRAAKSKRRALIRGASDGQPIDPIKVFERDKWLCHICGNKTLKSKRGTIHDRAPELEHMISLADGGTHTWGNVACSCRKCNQIKGANSFGQFGFSFSV